MVHFCEVQTEEWQSIREKLITVLEGIRETDKSRISSGSSLPQPATQHPPPTQPPPQVAIPERGPQPVVQREDPGRMQMRMRIAHVIRGVILIFALGLPKMFYYLYGVYGVFVLSGALDKLQSTEFRQLLTGARPSLDVQLARLRQRIDMLQKLAQIEQAIEQDEEFDSDEFRRVNEFLSSFQPSPAISWLSRFSYQLFFMFIYSALPACHPHPECIK